MGTGLSCPTRRATAGGCSFGLAGVTPIFFSAQTRMGRTSTGNENQLAQIVEIAKREFMRRGVSQHTLEKICNRKPVRVAKLAKCLKVAEELKKGAA